MAQDQGSSQTPGMLSSGMDETQAEQAAEALPKTPTEISDTEPPTLESLGLRVQVLEAQMKALLSQYHRDLM